jgi:hypothetical protein
LWRSKAALLATIAVVVVALGYFGANRLQSKRLAEVAGPPGLATQIAPVAAFNPPPHSIAVLPFADLSEKRDQEYFSDGLAEELLDLLTKTRDLQATARTSSSVVATGAGERVTPHQPQQESMETRAVIRFTV